MAISIPSSLVEYILLGPLDDRRQLQDTPILGDVWVEYGKRPGGRLDLLITPYRGQHTGRVAAQIDQSLDLTQQLVEGEDPASVAFLQGFIVARLTFEELMRVVVPKTSWWISRRVDPNATPTDTQEPNAGLESTDQQTNANAFHKIRKHSNFSRVIESVLNSVQAWQKKTGQLRVQEMPPLERFLALTGLLLWAGTYELTADAPKYEALNTDEQIDFILAKIRTDLQQISNPLDKLIGEMLADQTPENLIWQISRNRSVISAISKSIPAVKADAASYLFKVNCSEIGWAVIDSGIDGNHPAFLDQNGKSRIVRSFDFKSFRRIVSLSNSRRTIREQNIRALIEDNDNLKYPFIKRDNDDQQRIEQVHADLQMLAEYAQKGGPLHWEIIEKYLEIKPETRPRTNHGTHVAGIIGASKEAAKMAVARASAERAARRASLNTAGNELDKNVEISIQKAIEEAVEKVSRKENLDLADGMCPDIRLFDFRVLGTSIQDTEFAIIAALQFIRHLNSQDNLFTIHGANLSLSIPHDVRNFACGRTPVCNECEHLVASGVSVVAAAGNHGYKSFETKDGSYDGYAAFSITDPGNADSVLTVGATHRFWPHTYGISFFSSRGPTGDGRMKPDLVAPGERIRAPLPGSYDLGGDWGDLDGTSMAAPHVSGAAAMLMARYSELVGQPLRIKRILCESATDLGRERSFQGHGMLDVLRAFQSL